MERVEYILNCLEKHPEGLGFNELCELVKGRMARKTLAKKLNTLLDEKLVIKKPEKPIKGQKISYRSTEALERLNRGLQVLSFVSSQLIPEIENLLQRWEIGECTDESLTESIINFSSEIPKRVMGMAYVLAFGYGEETVQFILFKAFKLCNEAYNHMWSLLDKIEEKPAIMRHLRKGTTKILEL